MPVSSTMLSNVSRLGARPSEPERLFRLRENASRANGHWLATCKSNSALLPPDQEVALNGGHIPALGPQGEAVLLWEVRLGWYRTRNRVACVDDPEPRVWISGLVITRDNFNKTA